MYLTRVDLLERVSTKELAELATRDHHPVVDVSLLDAVMRGDPTDGYTAAEIAIAIDARTRIDRALADAAALIDGYLKARYALPLITVPTVLKRVACDVTRYYLMDQRATDEVRQRYEAQVKLLAAIERGQFSLGAEEPAGAIAGPIFVGGERVMTPDRLGGY